MRVIKIPKKDHMDYSEIKKMINTFIKKKRKNKLIEDFKESEIQRFQKCKGSIAILGPNPEIKQFGSQLRLDLKKQLQTYANDFSSKFLVFFPEDFFQEKFTFDMDSEINLLSLDDVKLIFGIWSKDAYSIDSEIQRCCNNPISARKLVIFMDREIWDRGGYKITKGEPKFLKETFNNIYFFRENDSKCHSFVIETAKLIFKKHFNWSVKHGNLWPND